MIFTALFMFQLLGKRFALRQLVAVILLVVGNPAKSERQQHSCMMRHVKDVMAHGVCVSLSPESRSPVCVGGDGLGTFEL